MARNLPQQLRYDKLGPNVVKALLNVILKLITVAPKKKL